MAILRFFFSIFQREREIELNLSDLGFTRNIKFRNIIEKKDIEIDNFISAKLKPNACLFGILE